MKIVDEKKATTTTMITVYPNYHICVPIVATLFRKSIVRRAEKTNHRCINVILATRTIVKKYAAQNWFAYVAILPIVTCVNVKTRRITTISSTKNRIFAPVVVELALEIIIFDTQNRRRNGREQAMYLIREKGGIFFLMF